MVQRFLITIFALITLASQTMQADYFPHEGLIIANNVCEIRNIIMSKKDILSEEEYNNILFLIDNIQNFVYQTMENRLHPVE